jgi:hypothetical protein
MGGCRLDSSGSGYVKVCGGMILKAQPYAKNLVFYKMRCDGGS